MPDPTVPGTPSPVLHWLFRRVPALDSLRTGQKVVFELGPGPRGRQASTMQAEPSGMAEGEAAMALPESTPAPREEKLHFVLQGDRVKGAAIVAETEAALEFRFGVPGDDQSARPACRRR